MVKLNGQEQLDLIYDLLLKGVGTSELQKLGINISKLSSFCKKIIIFF